MNRSMVCIGTVCAILGWTAVHASSSGEQGDARGALDWQGRVCANCQPLDNTEQASRLDRASRIATKLVAPNTCADPGPTAWFAEEEDHLSAFMNSRIPQYK